MKTNDYTNFPDWLEGELRRQGIIPAQLAKRMGVTNATVSNIINGMRKPKADRLNRIADALGLPAEEVYRAAGLIVLENENSATVNRIAFRVKKPSP